MPAFCLPLGAGLHHVQQNWSYVVCAQSLSYTEPTNDGTRIVPCHIWKAWLPFGWFIGMLGHHDALMWFSHNDRLRLFVRM